MSPPLVSSNNLLRAGKHGREILLNGLYLATVAGAAGAAGAAAAAAAAAASAAAAADGSQLSTQR